jgi:hypothetical protein
MDHASIFPPEFSIFRLMERFSMMNSPKIIQQDLETPVGWWRCTHAKGSPNCKQFEIGKLYPCVQNGRSKYPHGTPIPIHRRSYRIFPDLANMGQGVKTPFWDGPSQRFSCSDTKFEFVRRFTREERAAMLARGCDPHAFDSLGTVKPLKLGIINRLGNLVLGNPAPTPEEIETPSRSLKKYFYKTESTNSGRRAVVYNQTREWGDVEVAAFKYGSDAQEYIDFKNARYHGR